MHFYFSFYAVLASEQRERANTSKNVKRLLRKTCSTGVEKYCIDIVYLKSWLNVKDFDSILVFIEYQCCTVRLCFVVS